jgi:hypothetical protein
VQIDDIANAYRNKTDEELLLLARDLQFLTPEAVSALTDELARRKITAEDIQAFRKKEERRARKDRFRSKRGDARATEGWWLKIQLVAAYATGLLVYHLLPLKVPKEWEDAALVTFLCTVAIVFIFRELWQRVSFWFSLAIAAAIQIWAIKAYNPKGYWHHKDASLLIGFAVGFIVWGAMFLLLRRFPQNSHLSGYRRE